MNHGGSLPPMDVAGRLPRLQAALGESPPGHAALLVTHLTNVRYLTGFTGSAGLLLVRVGAPAVLITDPRYVEQAADEIGACAAPAEVAVGRTLGDQRKLLTSLASSLPAVGLEAEHVSWADQRRYASECFPSGEVVPCSGLVEALRAIKDPGEVARIERACSIADAALEAVAPLLEEQPAETTFARFLETEMRRLGADDISFETIVASGPNGSRPHHSPGERIITDGDLVVVDFGAMVDGYHSDMTRTFGVGGPGALDAEQRRMVDVVAAAQAAGVAAVAPGVATAEVDAACRAVIADAGWAEAFVHGTGHGVGLDIHEAPAVGATADATLAPGHVVTVEPGVYLPGRGGVRIEDTVVVTTSGHRTLTLAPKS